MLLLGGRRTDRWGHLLGTATVAPPSSSACCARSSWPGSTSRSVNVDLFTFISAGDLDVHAGLLFDPLSAAFVLLITGVGSLIHVYSIGYMAHDPGRRRFFAYLNLFVAAMLLLVLGNSYVALYVGWEGVGLASYLLIAFWYTRPAAATAAKKAFIMNRVGDVGLALAIFLMFAQLGTTSYAGVFGSSARWPAAPSPPWGSCSCSARAASPASSRCRRGCPTRWRARPRSRRSSTRRRWSPPAST